MAGVCQSNREDTDLVPLFEIAGTDLDNFSRSGTREDLKVDHGCYLPGNVWDGSGYHLIGDWFDWFSVRRSGSSPFEWGYGAESMEY